MGWVTSTASALRDSKNLIGGSGSNRLFNGAGISVLEFNTPVTSSDHWEITSQNTGTLSWMIPWPWPHGIEKRYHCIREYGLSYRR